MPANVETMMYAGDAPWHRLGVRVDGVVTSREAIEKSGLDWITTLCPIYAATTPVTPGSETVGARVVPGHRAVMRSTDEKVLGIVGERYRPIQNRDAFTFFDELVRQGYGRYETAGSLDGGRRVWILARMNLEIRVGVDDVVRPYLLLASSHDGTTSLRMLPTPVRVVCSNTLNLALNDSHGEGIAIRHTQTAPARLEQAMKALRVANRYMHEFQGEADRLLASRYSDAQMCQLAEALFPDRDGELSPRGRNSREKVIELFSEGIGHAPIRGTAWAAINAIAEFADHLRSVRTGGKVAKEEARLSASWFGTGAALKRQAHQVISQQLLAA